jgi:predicted nucleic acid-binding protein
VRSAPAALAVDAGILISAVLGRSAVAVRAVAAAVPLVTTGRAVEEASRRLALGMGRPDLLQALRALVAPIEVVPEERLSSQMAVAAEFLRDAAQSRNGSTSDAHILALAWAADAQIWSHDRDFAGTGVASWSTINLLGALKEAETGD